MSVSKIISILVFLLSIFFLGKFCVSNKKKLKNINYNFGKYKLKCTSEFKGNLMNGKSICYDSSGILFLEENYRNDTLNGEFTRYFSDGQIYRHGYHKNGKAVGAWKEYYKNKSKKIYKYFDPFTYKLIYQKAYDTLGNPNDVVLPIKIISDRDTVNLGEEISFQVELLHSEFDSLVINCYVDLDDNLDIWEDTIISFRPKFNFKVKTERKGDNLLQGDFHEFDSNLNWGGGYPFEVKYFVK